MNNDSLLSECLLQALIENAIELWIANSVYGEEMIVLED
jgi:hypothetical protein